MHENIIYGNVTIGWTVIDGPKCNNKRSPVLRFPAVPNIGLNEVVISPIVSYQEVGPCHPIRQGPTSWYANPLQNFELAVIEYLYPTGLFENQLYAPGAQLTLVIIIEQTAVSNRILINIRVTPL